MLSKAKFEALEKRIQQVLDGADFPLPAKPSDLRGEYTFPSEPSSMNSNQLGKLMLQLAGWRGYTARSLARQEASLTNLKAVYEILLGHWIAKLRPIYEKGSKRLIKEELTALAMEEDTTLQELFEKQLEKQAIVSTLRAQVVIYDGQWQALSRELTRRDSEKGPR